MIPSAVRRPPSANQNGSTAIYSGSIPSTEFIERLIKGLAQQGMEISLFGTTIDKTSNYPNHVKMFGNKRGWPGRIQAVLRIVLLAFRFPDRFRILNKELQCFPWQSTAAFNLWKRHVPVLLYLPDIFHIQWAKGTEEWLYLKKYFGMKLVLSLRGAHINYSPLTNPELEASYQRTFPQIHAFHAVSQAIANEAQKYGAEPQKIKIIYSGLPPIKEEDLRQSISTARDKTTFRLLGVGRFHWKKGYVYLLEALHLLRNRGISVQLTLIASGNMPEEERFLIHELNLQHFVIHIKGLPFPEVQQAMREHDALVLSSLEEGIANVVLEAMQIGLPVISTDCGGMQEAITHGHNGLLVPVRNPQAIADAVLQLIQMTDAELKQMIINARQTIEQQFNLNQAVAEFIQLYYETADGGRKAAE